MQHEPRYPRITIYQDTASIVGPRCLYASRHRFINSFRSFRSLADDPFRIRPRGGAFLIALRCFQSFVVAMNGSVSASPPPYTSCLRKRFYEATLPVARYNQAVKYIVPLREWSGLGA